MVNALIKKIQAVLKFLRVARMLSQTRGAILVEFAFALPILTLTLYFGLDVPRAYRVSDKLHKISELYAQGLLNVNKRRDSKAITMSDLRNISLATGLNITGTIANNSFPFNLSTYVVCVKGTDDGAFEVKWSAHVRNKLQSSETKIEQERFDYSVIKGGDTKLQGSLKNFVIKKGELKLLVETVAWYSGNARGFNNLFYLLSLPGTPKGSAKTLGDKFAIITPPEGVIDEIAPLDPDGIVAPFSDEDEEEGTNVSDENQEEI